MRVRVRCTGTLVLAWQSYSSLEVVDLWVGRSGMVWRWGSCFNHKFKTCVVECLYRQGRGRPASPRILSRPTAGTPLAYHYMWRAYGTIALGPTDNTGRLRSKYL